MLPVVEVSLAIGIVQLRDIPVGPEMNFGLEFSGKTEPGVLALDVVDLDSHPRKNCDAQIATLPRDTSSRALPKII